MCNKKHVYLLLGTLLLKCTSSCVPWCSESWLLTQEEKRRLKVTQNNMLRRIAGPRRLPEEDYVGWIKRSTRTAVAAAREAGVRLWVEEHYKAKWTWAGHVARMDAERFAKRATEWRDSDWWTLERETYQQSLRTTRPQRTRWFRWEDDLRRYAAKCKWASWKTQAADKHNWMHHCSSFIQASKGRI